MLQLRKPQTAYLLTVILYVYTWQIKCLWSNYFCGSPPSPFVPLLAEFPRALSTRSPSRGEKCVVQEVCCPLRRPLPHIPESPVHPHEEVIVFPVALKCTYCTYTPYRSALYESYSDVLFNQNEPRKSRVIKKWLPFLIDCRRSKMKKLKRYIFGSSLTPEKKYCWKCEKIALKSVN